MAFFEVVAIEGTAEQPVVVMRAVKATHLKNLKDANRNKDLEWALQVEFNLPTCQVRLLSPDQSPTVADPAQSYTAGGATLGAPHDSAFREPATLPVPPASPPAAQHGAPGEGTAPATDLYLQHEDNVSSPGGLARKSVIRENRQEAETLEQKARRDPVVQEVIRTFSAKIVDIHPK
jgi:hypothetical protein